MTLFTIVITLPFIIWGLISKRSKGAAGGLLFLLFVLFAFEHSDGDYSVYLRLYQGIGSGTGVGMSYEMLYVLLCKLGNQLKLSFDGMRGIISVVELGLLYATAKRYTRNVAAVLAMFMIFPAAFDAELFRWTMAMCVIIYAMRFLLEAKGFRDYVFYVLGVLIAGLLHTSGFLFIIYLLMLIKDRNTLRRVVTIALVVGLGLLGSGIFFTILSYLPIRDYVIRKYQIDSYANLVGILFQFVKLWLIYSMVFITEERIGIKREGKLCIRRLGASGVANSVSGATQTDLLRERIVDMNIISFLLLIPLYYSAGIQRLVHVVVFYNYVILAKEGSISKKSHVCYGAIVAVLLSLSLLFLEGSGTLAAFETHFTEGYFVNFFRTILGN